MEEDWNDKRQLEEDDNIIVKWAQEDVATLYSPLNNNIHTHTYIHTYSMDT